MLELLSIVSTTVSCSLSIHSNIKYIEKFFKTRYLCYDLSKLKSFYVDTELIEKNTPYEELHNFIERPIEKVVFHKKSGDFHLYDDNIPEIKSFQSAALSEFKSNGKMIFDSKTIRLEKFEVKKTSIHMTVAKCKYSDQVQTHLVLDWKNKHLKELEMISYRGYLAAKYKKKLPPLDTPFLSNSIGISVILYFKKDNYLVPYLPLRNKSILNKTKNEPALYEGVFTTSSSGVLEWSERELSMDYIKNEMYREIHEELGLEKNDIDLLECIALVRDLLRAGKPQIFFAGYINLTEEQLVEKRNKAIVKNQNDISAKVEIKNKHLPFSELKNGFRSPVFSFELAGNLYYSEKFFKSTNGIKILENI